MKINLNSKYRSFVCNVLLKKGHVSLIIKNYASLSNVSSRNVKLNNTEIDSHYFGFEKVSSSEKRDKVQTVFSEVAGKYDLMNDAMSLGIHRLWKDIFIQTLSPTPGTKLLDVAGGTGDIAFRFLQATLGSRSHDAPNTLQTEENDTHTNESHVVVLDMNDKMLSICNERSKEADLQKYLTCIQGNAECLPFQDNSFDAYTVAYGIRNVVHIDKALNEAHRVLRPGGRFLCLEFSTVKSPTLGRMYDWYSEEIIPVLGQVIAGNWKAYQYLVESIRKFPDQEEFSIMIEDAGFSLVLHKNLLNGISAIHSAYKL
ncbi:2-methoxy-6-polyprenyl-1,4-benzoquinol methylase, mitochondrial-like [Uloborus diversus]|uniref:2-methoxy-6-polyprenyl-1,4-benzoquinol methylase, mitochondrial-like n=1 Tax=Uloborus diversus TaxID=327109 RepID=UPI0024092C7E|nr:2-methoxy-6-polyprenyl-1,4-benzoquinol methylase, mitochondrial-like [Uloborus diversus]